MPETEIIFVRHAQSHPSGAIPDRDWPLSPHGRRQAQRLAPLLAELAVDAIVSSPFARCAETIEPFARLAGLAPVIHDDLRERGFGGGLVDNFAAVWRRSWEDFDFVPHSGESSRAAQRRMVQAMDHIVATHDGRRLAVASHGNVIGLFLNALDQEFSRQQAEGLRNPDVLRVVFARGAYRWDSGFRVPGLAEIATHHRETPIRW